MPRLFGAIALLCLSASLCSAQGAETTAAPPANMHQSQSDNATAKPPCTCRFAGRKFAIGEKVCIRGRMAECGMYLNNTSWQFSKDSCPLAMAGSGTMRR